MLCFSYIAYPLPVIVRGVCLFDNFEKLSMLLGLSTDILEGWARGCCLHVFLVQYVNKGNEFGSREKTYLINFAFDCDSQGVI